ncbi:MULTISPECIES: hypothetical protein [Halorussus]|uniref:hypothetical protein n=1 Tax=Halorussus TaxID=1070314 RepID=UPI000E2140AB|nr:MULTISPECIES: hypothetical protein [Halorussus]NHN57956.1 hypothetical protein [Halorussus sp. JP-T4]
MNCTIPPLNKRTALGGQFWAVGALGALSVHCVPFATVLVAVGVQLVLGPALAAGRSAGPFKLLLSPE